VLVALSLALGSAVGVVATTSTHGDSSASGCAQPRTLSIVAAAELVPAIETVSTSLRCVRVRVTAGDPSTVARQVTTGAAPADVWIPDSSRWVTGFRATSVAWSPVVLATSADKLRDWGVPTTFEGLAQAATGGLPLMLTADEPRRSATAQAALTELVDALSTTPTLRGHLAALVRGMGSLPGDGRSGPAVPVRASTEQAVWAENAESGTAKLRAVYAPDPGLSLDYPVVVTATEAAVRRDAQTLLKALTDPTGAAAIEALGFRSPAGQGNSLLTPANGVDATRSSDALPLSRRQAGAALGLLATLSRPTRVLALVDVSGSMAQSVPGGQPLSRIELARTAVRGSLELFPRGTVAGLWRFSSDLTPSTNYEQLMPLTPLTARSRRDFTASLDRLTAVPNGGTGLYDSVLAAVRYVRSGYDASRVNSVVVLSDGRNEYASAHGITKDYLLRALRKEAEPDRPVPVISVAYGPDSDIAALRAVSDVTGGMVYTARDPRDLPVIFRDAIGHRVCDGRCG
jgi:Ca-activated chloride channel family protein